MVSGIFLAHINILSHIVRSSRLPSDAHLIENIRPSNVAHPQSLLSPEKKEATRPNYASHIPIPSSRVAKPETDHSVTRYPRIILPTDLVPTTDSPPKP